MNGAAWIDASRRRERPPTRHLGLDHVVTRRNVVSSRVPGAHVPLSDSINEQVDRKDRATQLHLSFDYQAGQTGWCGNAAVWASTGSVGNLPAALAALDESHRQSNRRQWSQVSLQLAAGVPVGEMTWPVPAIHLSLDHPPPHGLLPTPSCLATTAAAAVNDGYSPRWSPIRRTAGAFNS
jgi:hypothetical protein